MGQGGSTEFIAQDQTVRNDRVTKPAEDTIDYEDIWSPPGERLNLVGLLLPAIAAILVVGGALMVGVLASSSFAGSIRHVLDSLPGNSGFWVLAGSVIIAAGIILFIVAYAYFRRTLTNFKSIVEKYRIEGVATMQTVQKLGPGGYRR